MNCPEKHFREQHTINESKFKELRVKSCKFFFMLINYPL